MGQAVASSVATGTEKETLRFLVTDALAESVARILVKSIIESVPVE